MSEFKRRVAVYECQDGYVIHDADKHIIYIYEHPEKIHSNKTVKEVSREI